MTNPFIDPQFPFHLQNTHEAYNQLSRDFINIDIREYNRDLLSKTEESWQKIGQEKSLHLFHLAAQHVPAYKDFLKQNKINHKSIKTFSDFANIPIINKKNYISKYPLESLCWHGELSHNSIISFSSGSTGDPFFWPRNAFEDYEGGFFLEHYLTSFFEIEKKTTLYVNCYSLGCYVAGSYIFTSAQLIANKGYPLTIITPGINYKDTFRMLKSLGSKYDQIILNGYPPFIKDILDMGVDEGIDWKSFQIKLLLSSDFFSEEWRDNILEMIGSKSPLVDSTNLYGTADATIFGLETPTTTIIRKLGVKNPQLNQRLYQSNLTPTLVQYNPALRYFETVNEELILTAATGIPLIRYALKDRGSTFTTSVLNQHLSQHNTNLRQELKRSKVEATHQNLPYLYLTNRTDGAVSYYAIKIYPEFIAAGIELPQYKRLLSGKFSALSTYNKKREQKLVIHVEMTSSGVATKELTKQIEASITQSLMTRCVEYAFLRKSLGKRALAKVILHKKGHSEYFKVAIKQKWIMQ